MSWFVSGTGTGVGKTFVSRGLVRALMKRGERVHGVKPVETGCNPDPMDALALERACGGSGLSRARGLYRASFALSPAAVGMRRKKTCVLEEVASVTQKLIADATAVVEGAGGVLVPLNETSTIADLITRLDLPVILVAKDGLGVLSDVLSAVEVCQARGLEVAAVVLNRSDPDDSQQENITILRAFLTVPVVAFERCADDDDALAAEVFRSGLLDQLRRTARD